jgi:nucleolar complex protein 2
MHRTRTYIPLSQYLLPILTTSISPTYGRLKPSTLKPLDLETSVRAPQQYLKTRVYSETLAEEAAFLLAEWFSSRPVQGSIAFPEISVPVLVVLRKALKTARNAPKGRGGKEAAVIKALVDRVEDSTRWIEKKRSSATFGPAQLDEIFAWEKALNIEDSPIFKYLSVQRKTREKKRQLVEKARKGEDEMLED